MPEVFLSLDQIYLLRSRYDPSVSRNPSGSRTGRRGAGLRHLWLQQHELTQVHPGLTTLALAGLAFLGVGITALLVRRAALADHQRAIRDLAAQIQAWRDNPSDLKSRFVNPVVAHPDLQPLIVPLSGLVVSYRQALIEFIATNEQNEKLRLLQERVGLEIGYSLSFVAGKEGINRSSRRLAARLTPSFHWMAATPALQKFLGDEIADLTARSFLDIVFPEDAATLSRALTDAVRDGEGHNITFRVQVNESAVEKSKGDIPSGCIRFLQMDVLTRYTNEGAPLHLRCHFVDITERIRNDRELRLRTDALQKANARLRQINTDLKELKEAYLDLYNNAPALYFSLDSRGHFFTCNDKMVTSLGYSRLELIGQPYSRLLPLGADKKAPDTVADFRQTRNFETRWIKKDGTLIDVWINTSPILDPQGRFKRSRSIANDVTERNRLMGELIAQGQKLEQANERLSRINQELDQFTHVVSHDLKEPLRTLEAFSTFLATDCGPQLGTEGQGYIEHLVQASRRLGRLIDDLLRLSRVGRVLDTPSLFLITGPLQTALSDLTAHRIRPGDGPHRRIPGALSPLVGRSPTRGRAAEQPDRQRPEVQSQSSTRSGHRCSGGSSSLAFCHSVCPR